MAIFKYDSGIDPQSPTRPPSTLVLQDAKGVWATFVNGICETDDKSVIARLAKVEGVSEVKSPEGQE